MQTLMSPSATCPGKNREPWPSRLTSHNHQVRNEVNRKGMDKEATMLEAIVAKTTYFDGQLPVQEVSGALILWEIPLW